MWPERLPALPSSLRALPEVDRWEQAMGQWWHDFRAALDRLAPGSSTINLGSGGSGTGGTIGSATATIFNQKLEAALSRIEKLEASVGDAAATIIETNEVVVTPDTALARRTLLLEARVAESHARLTEVWETFASREYAQALKRETLSASYNSAHAMVEEEAVARVTKDGYMHGHYVLRVNAGNKITGMKLTADSDPSGWNAKSAIEFQADVFKISTGALEGQSAAPFILDGTTLTLNANLVVNGADSTLAELAENAAVPGLNFIGEFADDPSPSGHPENSVYRNSVDNNSYILQGGTWVLFLEAGAVGTDGGYTDIIFKRSATAPATPTGDAPSGWSDAPPAGTDYLWFSRGSKTNVGVLVGSWSSPARITGDDGPAVEVEYSTNGSTGWHSTYAEGDFYMRQRVGSGGAWSAAMRFIGEEGWYLDYVFKRAATQPATPTGNSPAGWSDAPPTGTDELWMSTGWKNNADELQGTWSDPVRLGGEDGDSLAVEYSVDGSTSWHTTFNVAADLYMRQKLGTGEWTSAMRIVGERGGYWDLIFKRSATQPTTPTGDAPAGWSDGPPAGSDYLWFSRGWKRDDDVLEGTWSTPARMDGESLDAQYSADGATNWHSPFNPATDYYARFKVAGTWGAAMRIVGEAGNYTDYVFKRSATTPATPTGSSPSGWSDAPPAGTDPLYMAVGDKTSAGVLIGTWSAPVRIDADAGASVSIEYSSTGSGSWHSTFTAGDLYMRQRVGSGDWSAAIRIVGEKGTSGNFIDYVFIRSASPTTPTGNVPAGWSDAPPTGTDPLWMATAEKTADGVLVGAWSAPARLDGVDGDSVSVEYSADDASWHATFNPAADLFMRVKVGDGAWGASARIVGEQGGYTDYVFKRSASAPATPTGSSPAGWSDAPPAGTDPLYLSKGVKLGSGTLVGAWSTPVRIDADAGASVSIEYSVDGSTSWHSTFSGGDLYMRQKVGSGAWSAAIRIVGESGGYTDYVFKRSASAPATPTGNTPAGWSDAPPTGADQLWMSSADKTAAGTLVGAWSTPVNLGGADGDPVIMEYSADGATNWHSTFSEGDLWARHKIGTGGTFTSAYRIVGEQGITGGYIDYVFKRAATQPTTPTGNSPAGWSDAPPAGSDPLWMSKGAKTASGVLTSSWSAPARLDADAGASISVEYSTNGTSWHASFQSGDFYMRQRVGTGAWSDAIRIVGEAGSYTDYVFKRAAAQPATPTGNTPSGWNDAPPAGTDPLWMAKGTKSAAGVLSGAWSTPVRLDGVAGGYTDYVFIRSATQPATPTGDAPAGWADAPPTGTDQLWMAKGTKTSAGVLVGAWSTPVNLGGADGDPVVMEYSVDGVTNWHATYVAGDYFARHKIGAGGTFTDPYRIVGESGASVSVQYSVDGSSSWHDTFNPAADLFMRLKIGNGAWSSAARIVGEQGNAGNYTDIIFKRNATAPATPTGNSPAGWSDAPPAGTDPLWMAKATKTASGVLVGAWSTPARIDSDSTFVEYSVNGSTSWHSTFTAGDLYMRQKVGANGTWSAAIRIVGEQGPQGTPGTPGSNGQTPYLHIKYSDDGGATFTASNGEAVGKWMGQYVDFSAFDSNSPGAYVWARIAGVDGTNGLNGTNGTNGERGSKAFVRAISGTSWSDSEADAAITVAGMIKVLLDQVTLTKTGSTWSEMRFWSGTAWVKPEATINGDMLVRGTIGTEHIAASISITTPTIVGGTLKLQGACTVCSTSADGSDTSIVRVNGGGGDGPTRGAQLDVIGNEHPNLPGYEGSAILSAGNAPNGTVRLKDRSGYERVIVKQDGGVWVTSNLECDGQVEGGSFNKASSRRWKTKVTPLVDGLALLRRLRPVRFDWRTKNVKDDFGFIAEEVYQVVPTSVATDGLGNCTGVDYGHVATLAIAGLQELAERVERLERN